MHPIRHLLCPVDLSESSALALRYAAVLRSMLDGDLTIVYVRTPGARESDPGKSLDSLDSFVASIQAASASARLLEREGEPVTEILATAGAAASDLIVMGTHGRTGLQRLLLGSVAERVIRRSPIPVLTVPPGMKNAAQESINLQTVLCAVDFSESSPRALEYAASIATAAQARLVLAHALEWSEELDTIPQTGTSGLPSSEDDALARLNGLLIDEMHARSAPELMIGYGEPADEVLRLVRECKVDLVVLGARRRNPIDLMVFGSTTQRLIREGACAVLTVRALEST
jgi:nucleotide-binding universal stress UspA family protein